LSQKRLFVRKWPKKENRFSPLAKKGFLSTKKAGASHAKGTVGAGGKTKGKNEKGTSVTYHPPGDLKKKENS